MVSTNDSTKASTNCTTESSERVNVSDSNGETETSTNDKVPVQKSRIWEHFTKQKDCLKAKCHHFLQPISCKTKAGSTTSAMLKHINVCRVLNREVVTDDERDGKRLKQSTLHHQSKKDGSSGSMVPSYLVYDPIVSRKALVEMKIMDELPFSFVDRKGFIRFMSVTQPRFEMPSRRTVTRETLNIFEEERCKLRKIFKNYKGSVCLTTDTWTSIQNLNYMCLTAHYIDEDWKLHKRVLNFCLVDNHAGETIGRMVEKCLVFWGISKVFTITVDNARSNDLGLKYLKKKLTSWGTTVLDGEFLHMRCGTHILSLVVKEGLKDIDASVLKIRSAVRYVRASPSRQQNFKQYLELHKVETKAGLCLDVETRWNSTFLMLESALKLKKGFDVLELEDDKYNEDLTRICKGAPSKKDWDTADALLPILRYFYDATLNISGSKYVTGNTYMKEIFGVGLMIIKMDTMGDKTKKDMAEKMKAEFNKYWGNYNNMNLMIYVAVVLDPRYKMKWIKWVINGVYPKEDAECLLGMINDTLDRLFVYCGSLLSKDVEKTIQDKRTSMTSSCEKEKAQSLMDSMFDEAEESEDIVVVKSELECYMDEAREDRKNPAFDILFWWKTTGSKYKILSMMARDFLAIPVSTVASESAFSAGGRLLDPFRSSLTPRIVEALVCTQDWYRDDEEDLKVEETLYDLENIESEVKSNSDIH